MSNCSQSHEKYATSGAKNHGMHTFSPADVSLGVCMPVYHRDDDNFKYKLAYIHARLTVTE